MFEMNLLPWRTLAREKQQRLFLFSVSFVMISFLLIEFVIHFLLDYQIKNKIDCLVLLEKKQLTLRDQAKPLENKKQVVDQLTAASSGLQHFENKQAVFIQVLNDLIQVMPDSIYLTQLNYVDDHFNLVGFSSSASELAIFVSKLKNFNLVSSKMLASSQVKFQLQRVVNV